MTTVTGRKRKGEVCENEKEKGKEKRDVPVAA